MGIHHSRMQSAVRPTQRRTILKPKLLATRIYTFLQDSRSESKLSCKRISAIDIWTYSSPRSSHLDYPYLSLQYLPQESPRDEPCTIVGMVNLHGSWGGEREGCGKVLMQPGISRVSEASECRERKAKWCSPLLFSPCTLMLQKGSTTYPVTTPPQTSVPFFLEPSLPRNVEAYVFSHFRLTLI